jgi:cell wall-associated NlpC family hydrolase
MKFRFIIYFIAAIFLFTSCGASKNGVRSLNSKIINYAGQFTGVPYKTGGATPSGFDCSGFTQYVFNKFNYHLPRSTAEQSKAGINVDKKNIKQGDLVFFTGKNQKSRKVGHVGIVVESSGKGNFLFIHASTSKGVTISSSLESYYKQRYLSARRIVL